MKHFYDNQDDEMRSKFNEHEFDVPKGAWENMENKLNRLEVPNLSKSLAPWVSLGAMCVGIVALLYYYQIQMPYGKTEKIVQNKEQFIESKENEKSDKEELKSLNSEINKSKVNSHNAVQQESTVLQSNANSIVDQGRTIEPALFNQSIKSDRIYLSELPKKLDPIAGFSSDENSSIRNFLVDNKVENKIEVINKNSVERSPENERKFAENQHVYNVSTLEHKSVLPLRKTIDTPLLALKTPHIIPVKMTEFGISVGVNTKIFGDNDLSVAPAAGVFVRHYLNCRFAIQGDLQYKMLIKNRKNKSSETLQMDVDPGEEILMQNKTAEVYNMQTAHIMELPVSFVYRLNRKHNVSLGINTACLFAVKTTNDDINNLSQKELGFSSLDLGALAAYEYNINKNLSIAISYNVGFLNLSRNVSNRQQELMESNPAYRINRSETEEACLMPVQLNNQEQVFFEAPTHFYNNDAKVLLRYNF